MNLLSYTDRWSSRRLGYLFAEQNEKNSTFSRNNALKFTYGAIVAKLKYEATPELIETYSNYTMTDAGDIVINCLNLNYDYVSQRVAIVKEDGIITSAYIVLRAKDEIINPNFYCYYFKAMDSRKMFHGMGTGIRLTLSYNELKRMSLPVPPRAEQDAIVRFLDAKIAQIDRLIALKEQQVSEIAELRKAIIAKVIAQGLNDNVAFRPVADKWLKKIPAHWEYAQIRRKYNVILGKMLATSPSSPNDTVEEYLCAKDVHFEGVNLTDDIKQMWFSPAEKKQYRVQENDLLVVEGGAGAGNAAIVTGIGTRKIYVQNSVQIVRAKDGGVLNQYLAYWLGSLVARGYMKCICSVATIPHFTKDKLLSTMMPLPPIAEQQAIVNFIDNKSKVLDKIESEALAYIERLKELRETLIADVVTGRRAVI